MLPLLLLLLQLTPGRPPFSGVELSPDDPQRINQEVMIKCINIVGSGGCRVKFTPGTYYLRNSVNLPNGVVEADFTGVRLIVCAQLQQLVYYSTIGPYGGAKVIGLNDWDASQPCGTYTPPLSPQFVVVRAS